MDGKRLFSWGDLAVPLLVLVILVSVAVIQFDWFRRSAEVEVKTAKNTLGDRILQLIGREFQSYSSLTNELRMAKDLEGIQAGEFLEKQFGSFIQKSGMKQVIRRVGWTDMNLSSARIFDQSQQKWVQENYPLPPAFEGELKNHDLIMLSPPENGDSLLVGYMNERHILLFFELDQKLFFEQFIRPAVQETLPGYQFELVQEVHRPDPETWENFDPWSTIFLGGKEELFLPLPPLPNFLQPPRFFQDRQPEGVRPPLRGDLFRGPGPRPEDRPEGRPEARPSFHRQTIHVILPNGAQIHGVAQRLAWIWLFTMVLLVLVGAVFLINFYQAVRMRQLARKEREFVAGVTHELRTPLTVIQSAADNLIQGIVPREKMGLYGQTIRDQAVRLGRMVEEMLLFAQVESQAPGHQRVEEVALSAFLKDLQEPLGLVAQKEGKTLVWKSKFKDDPVFLLDRDGLELILKNLVMNALAHAYSQTGEIRVFLGPGKLDKNNALVLWVEDDGRGIAPKDQKAVFEPFFRDEVSRNRQERGSGLGLFLVSKKIETMGGLLKLESPYKRENGNRRSGCRFTIKLPVYGKVPTK